MPKKRRTHSRLSKARVALEALKEQSSLAELDQTIRGPSKPDHQLETHRPEEPPGGLRHCKADRRRQEKAHRTALREGRETRNGT